jgi:hypothetical protein
VGFQERVTIFIETKVDQAKGGLAGFRQQLAQAEGAVTNSVSTFRNVRESVGKLFDDSGIGAAAKFAAKAVGAFQDLGVSVGKFSDATGTSAEEASRFVEVFGDLGVAPDAAAAAIGRMSKTLATNADALNKYGIEAVKAADGTTDVSATFLAAVDAISKIKDPAQQAAAAQATFGKSWQSMAEVVTGGAPALKAALDSVGDAKVLSAADVKSARELRDALDSIKDAGEGLMLSLGKSLAPSIAKIAPEIANLVDKAQPAFEALGESIGDSVESLGPLIDGIALLAKGLGALHDVKIDLPGEAEFKPFLGALGMGQQAWDMWRNQFGDAPELKGSMAALADGVTDVGLASDASKEDVKAFADTQKDLAKWVSDSLKALQEQADQLAEQSGAYTTAADDQNAYNDTLAEFAELNADASASVSDLRDKAIDAAKGHQALYESLTEASGATATATGLVDAQNQSLLASAATARGPAKSAILDYIGAVNGIPPEKMTEIRAAIERGDLAEAQRLLDEASEPRKAAFNADATNSALAQTNKDLDAAAHDRTVKFNAAAGTIIPGLAQLQRLAAGGTSVNNTYNVQVPRIPNARELARVSARWARVNGKG